MAEDDEKVTDPTQTVKRHKVEDNSLGRLLTLADGIFAIAMTLLALDLTVPDDIGSHPSSSQLWDALHKNSANYLSFLVSFYVIANYWVRHRRLMRSVTAVHPALIRDTLYLLLIVVAMPFFTALLAAYGSTPLALALYGGANALAMVVLMLLSRDIKRLGLSERGADPNDYTRSWQTWLTLAVFLLCIPAGFVLGRHGPWVLVLLAVPNRVGPLHQLVARFRRSPST